MMFYKQPITSKSFTPADSAMGRVQRNQIVANDVTRMMRRMSPKLVVKETEELVRVINNANNRLKYSGYNFSERLHIIESRIPDYRKKEKHKEKTVKECSKQRKKQEEE